VDKRRVSTFVTAKIFNPLLRGAARAGFPLPGVVILETVGRRSGKRRRIPVGKALDGDTLWIVAEHGRRAGYVRNVEANPRVRVKVGRSWRSGTARPMPDDDPRARQRAIPNKRNSAMVRAMGSDLLTVRVDLEPEASGAPPGRRPRSG
jgi:deazaflavin-dependent oxidoreductase (nitroreductase family)